MSDVECHIVCRIMCFQIGAGERTACTCGITGYLQRSGIVSYHHRCRTSCAFGTCQEHTEFVFSLLWCEGYLLSAAAYGIPSVVLPASHQEAYPSAPQCVRYLFGGEGIGIECGGISSRCVITHHVCVVCQFHWCSFHGGGSAFLRFSSLEFDSETAGLVMSYAECECTVAEGGGSRLLFQSIHLSGRFYGCREGDAYILQVIPCPFIEAYDEFIRVFCFLESLDAHAVGTEAGH